MGCCTRIVIIAFGLATGIPTSELGCNWLFARQAIQLENCAEDATKPFMDAAATLDEQAMGQALSPDRMQHALSCGNSAVKHPEGSLSFLWNEHKRLSSRSGE